MCSVTGSSDTLRCQWLDDFQDTNMFSMWPPKCSNHYDLLNVLLQLVGYFLPLCTLMIIPPASTIL